MDPTLNLPPLNIPDLLRRYGLRPKKSLGQNFLSDPVTLERITKAAEITSQTNILEIGPGLGSLTRYLAKAGREVVAVELDGRLLPVLEEVLSPWQNVRILQGDILELDPAALMPEKNYLVVANIPYYITSALLRHLLESKRKPARLVLTVQREVAERICAPAGDLSLLALSVQVYGHPKIVLQIPAGAFYPAPKIDSAVLRVDLYSTPPIPGKEIDIFFRLVKAGFSQKRKTLRNALSSGLRLPPTQTAALLEQAGIDPQRRAETVRLEEWQSLVKTFLEAGSEPAARFKKPPV